MAEIFCLAEHRRGELMSITFELLCAGRRLAEKLGAAVCAVLLGHSVDKFAQQLRSHCERVVVIDDPKLANFNQIAYQKALAELIRDRRPVLTMIGHTAYGMDLAPSLAVETGLPLATDCVDFVVHGDSLFAIRQMYGGKVNARVSFINAKQYLVTIRQGAFPTTKPEVIGEVVTLPSPLESDAVGKKFLSYAEPESGGVDIAQADVLVAIGRGIKSKDNMPMVEELAAALGGVLACSRPVVDSGWLPKDRQVGLSGKTVRAKLYLALGISGAFQHVVGIKGCETVIAVNKDPNAPIFGVSDYAVVADLLKLVPLLTKKIQEAKGQK